MGYVDQSQNALCIDDDHLQVWLVEQENGSKDEGLASVEEGHGEPLHQSILLFHILAVIKYTELLSITLLI